MVEVAKNIIIVAFFIVSLYYVYSYDCLDRNKDVLLI
jgi:hypothetical protein